MGSTRSPCAINVYTCIQPYIFYVVCPNQFSNAIHPYLKPKTDIIVSIRGIGHFLAGVDLIRQAWNLTSMFTSSMSITTKKYMITPWFRISKKL